MVDKKSEPEYYSGNGCSPLTAMKKGLISHEEYIGFLKGNVIKYVVRAGKKDNAVEDIGKAIDYLQYLKKEYLKRDKEYTLSENIIFKIQAEFSDGADDE